MSEKIYGYFKCEIGTIEICVQGDAIASLYFVEEERQPETTGHPVIEQCQQQLQEYFSKQRTDFELPLAPAGTRFQREVWSALLAIPFGTTQSYLDIAMQLGDRRKIRAVGRANGQNPISLIVPCHRVIGSNGKLIGYGGGLWRKEWLLRHEGAILI